VETISDVIAPGFRLRLREPDDDPEPSPELKLFQQAARLDPYDGDYHYILGRALLRARRFSDAAALCREAIRLNGQDADYSYALGAALWGLEKYEDAEDAFRDAVRLRPDDTGALNGLACALTRLGRHREAIAVFHRALDQAPSAAELRGNLGVVLWAHGRIKGAVRAFREAVRLAPEDAEQRRNLGLALAALGQHEEALALFERLAKDRPADPESQLDLAEVLHALGRDVEMGKAIDEALSLDVLALAARPHIRAMLDAQRLRRLREELAREPRRYRFPLGSRLLLGLGHAFAALGELRRPLARALTLGFLAVIGYAAWHVVPVQFTRYLLQDDIVGIAGAPVREDADILDRLMHAVEERGLGAHIGESNFEIRTRPKWRRIICRYEVPVQILPGLVHTFRFHIETEKPYIPGPNPT
jgi:tetratricopeptide (TPR) repeat protein